jgi:hypothetical protein
VRRGDKGLVAAPAGAGAEVEGPGAEVEVVGLGLLDCLE